MIVIGMRRGTASCVVLLALASQRAGAAPGSDLVSLDVSEEIGLLSTSRTLAVAGYTRRLADDRLYVELRLGGGAATDLPLWVVDTRAGFGVVFAPHRRVEVQLGWRVGDTYLRGNLGDAPYRRHLLVVELVAELQIALADRWRLRMVPAAPTLTWHTTYGGTLGLELGVERAL